MLPADRAARRLHRPPAGRIGHTAARGCANSSLGERQRIATARALIGSAPVIVFDECTASLDPSAERAVLAAIELLSRRATVVLVTHRLATVRNAGRIIVMAHGRVAETGTHAALVAGSGECARLWSAYEAAHVWRVAG